MADDDSFAISDILSLGDFDSYIGEPSPDELQSADKILGSMQLPCLDQLRVGNNVGNEVLPFTDNDQAGDGEGCDEVTDAKVVTKSVAGDTPYPPGKILNGFESKIVPDTINDNAKDNAAARQQQEKAVAKQKSTGVGAGKTNVHKGGRKQKATAGIRAPKVPWTPRADEILNFLVEQSGVTSKMPWTNIARKLNQETDGYVINGVGHLFTANNCKKRYGNRGKKISPHQKWEPPEDHELLALVRKHGNKWKEISEGMNAMGFVRGSDQCAYRAKNLKKSC